MSSAEHDPASGRRIHLNAFDMNCVAHQSPGAWRHPQDRSSRYRDLRYWTELGALLERGLFDAIFIADVLGVYDVYGGTPEAALRQGAQVPVNDPLLLAPAIALATENLGIGVTTSISFEHPYPFARRMSTLDHLTGGRIGWNIVTSYLDSGARNLGQAAQLRHDNRYDVADEYLEVLYKLWEGSWEDDAVVADRERGVFTDPTRVHPIGHVGEHFQVPGIHLCEPSPQRTPFLFQAGMSPRGMRFAAENAEAIFTAAPTKAILKRTVADIRAALVAAGRDPYDALIFNLHTVITGPSSEAAHHRHRDILRYTTREGALVFMSGWMGIDLSRYALDAPLGDVTSEAVHSAISVFQEVDPHGREWTIADIADWGRIGGIGPVSVGSPDAVATQLEEWADETDVDGFNLAYAITPGTFEDVVDHLVPELQRRGRYPHSYAPGTLRRKLTGRDRLPDGHPGARHRHLADRCSAELAAR